MLKAVEIINSNPYKIVCKFNTGEIREINLENLILESNSLVNKEKLLDPAFFNKAAIGNFGELFWENAAYIRDLKGEMISCEFDLSPEFVYFNSKNI